MATINKKFVTKHGLHTQNIDLVSPDGLNTIQVTMLNTDTLSFSGDSGQLFSITDSLSGTIFAVNDISGVPSIEVDDDGTIRFAEIFGNVLIGTATDDGTNKLQVNGIVSATGGNSTQWNTAYGWGDHSTEGYLTSYTETDPIFSASAASGITTTNITNWNTAYGWGDHSTAGYLTSYTETDPIFSASAASGITTTNITNWNTAYGWGDHSTAGYLTSYTETDPVFSASAASGITTTNITNWNT